MEAKCQRHDQYTAMGIIMDQIHKIYSKPQLKIKLVQSVLHLYPIPSIISQTDNDTIINVGKEHFTGSPPLIATIDPGILITEQSRQNLAACWGIGPQIQYLLSLQPSLSASPLTLWKSWHRRMQMVIT